LDDSDLENPVGSALDLRVVSALDLRVAPSALRASSALASPRLRPHALASPSIASGTLGGTDHPDVGPANPGDTSRPYHAKAKTFSSIPAAGQIKLFRQTILRSYHRLINHSRFALPRCLDSLLRLQHCVTRLSSSKSPPPNGTQHWLKAVMATKTDGITVHRHEGRREPRFLSDLMTSGLLITRESDSPRLRILCDCLSRGNCAKSSSPPGGPAALCVREPSGKPALIAEALHAIPLSMLGGESYSQATHSGTHSP
jgi:hypothetical protein